MTHEKLMSELKSLQERVAKVEQKQQMLKNQNERLSLGLPIYEDEKNNYVRAKEKTELDFINDALSFAKENPHLASKTVPWTKR